MRADELKPGQHFQLTDLIGAATISGFVCECGTKAKMRTDGSHTVSDVDLSRILSPVTPLGPVTSLDDPPRVTMFKRTSAGETVTFEPSIEVVLVSDLQGRCLVSDSDERDVEDKQLRSAYCQCSQSDKCPLGPKPGMSPMCTAKELREALIEAHAKVDTLTARVAELERTIRRCVSVVSMSESRIPYKLETADDIISDHVAGLESKAAQAKSELATLREGQVLGSPLDYDGWDRLPNDTPLLVIDAEGKMTVCKAGSYAWHTAVKIGCRAYLDRRPLPALPSPVEEVPEQKPMDWNEYTRVPAEEKILLVNETGVRVIHKRHTEWVDSAKFYRLPLKQEGEPQ